jgi:type I restriction enzyme, S subunit
MASQPAAESAARGLPPIPQEWNYAELGDLLEPDGLSYGIVQPGSEDTDGVPILRVKNLLRNGIQTDDVLRVGIEVEQKFSRSRLIGGEVLLSLVGSVGVVAVAPPSLAGWNVARAIAVIRVTNQANLWVKYSLSSDIAQHYMSVWQTTTVQATLNLRDVRRLPIALPPVEERDAVVALLGALDDKIAVNGRVVRATEELRVLRFRQWERSNQEFVESRPLSSFASFVNGRAFTKDATGTGRMVLRIAEINSGPGASTIYNDVDVPDVHLARPGDVLFAWSGSLAVTRWYRPEAIVNQHIFKVIPNAGVPVWLAYELLREKLADFKSIAAGKATTMGHIQRHHLDEPVPTPKWDHMAALDAELGPLWDRALAAEQESLTLAELRDTLLPRLMSGELRVREAERIVGDAT